MALRPISAYGLAFACVALSTLVRYSLGIIEPRTLLFATYFPAVLIATLYGGRGPGITSLLLSLLTAWYLFIPPPFTLTITDFATGLNLSLYAFSAGLLIWVADRYRETVEALKRSEERRRLLAEELQHRSKNTLSVATALVSSTLASDRKMADQLISRMRIALATDDLYQETSDPHGMLHHLLLAELKPYGPERFFVQGEHVEITPRQSRNLALVFHELTTNSAKYGALSVPDGFLKVQWTTEEKLLVIDWHERGRSTVGGHETPASFGSRLMASMVRDLQGTIERSGDDQTYHCRICVPLKSA